MTVAGSSGTLGSSRSQLNYPSAISVSSNQTMFILDTNNFRVLKWKLGDPMGYIIAGGNGNGGAYTQMGYSYGISVTSSYDVFVCEQTNHRVMKWFNGNNTAGILVQFFEFF